MKLKSLDPRINRLGIPESWDSELVKEDLDQLPTFEVFVQARDARPYQHEGIVHAPDEEMAFVFAKEQFSRRYTCTGIWTVKTENVFVTDYLEGDQNIFDLIDSGVTENGDQEDYEIFFMVKRGKQHKHAGTVKAGGYQEALAKAGSLDTGVQVFNVWIAKAGDFVRSRVEDKDIWDTLPEKKFRDATAYKAADKIQKFKEEQS